MYCVYMYFNKFTEWLLNTIMGADILKLVKAVAYVQKKFRRQTSTNKYNNWVGCTVYKGKGGSSQFWYKGRTLKEDSVKVTTKLGLGRWKHVYWVGMWEEKSILD